MEELSLPLLTNVSSGRTSEVRAALLQQRDKSFTLLALMLVLSLFVIGRYSKPAKISLEFTHSPLTSYTHLGKDGTAFLPTITDNARLNPPLPEGWSWHIATFL